MHRHARHAALALSLLAGAGCKKNNPAPAARPDAARPDAQAPSAADNAPLTVPESAVFVLRGNGVRKLLNIVAPGAPTRLALGQVAPGLSPGIGEHGVDVDPDAPFAALALAHGEERGRITLAVAWPLRSGMQVAQDAQAGRGYREVMQGIYEPTSPPADTGDAGVLAARNPCWVARKQPVGWMLVCGPRDSLRSVASYLVRAGSRAPDGEPVLDLTFRPEAARPLLASQLAALEAQDPRRLDAGAGNAAELAMVRAQYEQVHRTATTYKAVVDDLRALHATLTIDDARYHVRGEAEFANATSATTRAMVASTVGRRAAAELLARLPASMGSYLAMSLDGAALGPLAGGDDPVDPQVQEALGPEFVRFQRALQQLTGMRRAGERAMGFDAADNGTKVEVMRVADAAAALQEIRAAAAAVPRTPRASGHNPGDQFAVLPSPPSLPAGSLRLRLNPDPARLPPNAPAEMRRMYARTTLLVPDGDTLYLIEAQDPVARWNAMQQGQHLAVNVPEERAGVMHLSPMSLLMLLGVPATQEIAQQANGDPIDGNLVARRLGDSGARFELQIDAPVASVNQVQGTVAAIQAQQQQAMQERAQQMQRMQAQMAAARRAQQPRGPGMPSLPVPESPDQLPEPNFQLRAPPQ